MVVIADDITGAAEVAGLAFQSGRQVRLVCSGPADDCCAACDTGAACDTDAACDAGAACDTLVVATDTRSMTAADAMAETRRIAARLSLAGCGARHLFKKTDSALRGHVVAELTALMQASGCQRAVYMPANPSKGRILRRGICFIDGVPIHQTAFSSDPEFPARTSCLRERFPDAQSHHILMPDAESEADIRRIITRYDDGTTLFAGAADLFGCLLPTPSRRRETAAPEAFPAKVGEGSLLVLCGSTQGRPLDTRIPVSPMPLAVYDGLADLSLWDVGAYSRCHSLVLTIPHHHRTGKETAVHLRTVMAQITRQLVAVHRPDHLVVEGGATAWAALQALGWHRFTIVGQLAPGVVQMRADGGTLVTLKPGSYPWPFTFSPF